jgi:hypothetical protein
VEKCLSALGTVLADEGLAVSAREALAEARDAAPRALAATTLAAMRGLLPEPEAR